MSHSIPILHRRDSRIAMFLSVLMCSNAVANMTPTEAGLDWFPIAAPLSGNVCGPPNTNSCFQHNSGPGCSDATCCETVCAIDSFCCDSQWDETCAVIASVECEMPTVCPGTESCFLSHTTVGCHETDCCEQVCLLQSSCCEDAWSESCAALALEVCNLPSGCPAAGDCFSSHGTLGCDNGSCCAIVCAHQPACCIQPWDTSCVETALLHCDGESACPAAESCFEEHNSGGCEQADCCASVCANDPYCCQTAWDARCVVRALVDCAGTEVCGAGGYCFKAGEAPGCEDVACCTSVCIENPDCCLVAWSEDCVAMAEQTCMSIGSCPGEGSCFAVHETPGCADAVCCDVVCENDSVCCETAWDEFCVDGAVQWCEASWTCPGVESCNVVHESPGCESTECCMAVCAMNPGCCLVGWDAECVELAKTCGVEKCSDGTIVSAVPPSGTVDARQPHGVNDPLPRMGIGSPTDPIRVTLSVTGASECFEVCETATDSLVGAVSIATVSEMSGSQYEIVLSRAITAGAVTTIRFLGDGSFVSYIAHPANVNGDGVSNPVDILFMIDILNGVSVPPHGTYGTDIDRSNATNPADVLRVIDLLNGAGAFEVWNGIARPVNSGECP